MQTSSEDELNAYSPIPSNKKFQEHEPKISASNKLQNPPNILTSMDEFRTSTPINFPNLYKGDTYATLALRIYPLTAILASTQSSAKSSGPFAIAPTATQTDWFGFSVISRYVSNFVTGASKDNAKN
jgi:hypothetical protein